MSRAVADQWERLEALDTSRSFIVQAPAGSGKTTLLIARHLKLLSLVDKPESIVAITFTRKAAAEMRNRIMEVLALAMQAEPLEEHEKVLWRLGNDVLARDGQLSWQLQRNPNRLQIQTIDSLTARLVRMMPLLSQSGGALTPIDDAMPLYKEAARLTLLDIENSESWSDAISELLLHLDNNFSRLEQLIASMLAKRDQWLRLVLQGASEAQRNMLESTLQGIVLEKLEKVARSGNNGIIQQLAEYAHLSARTLERIGKAQQGWQIYSNDASPPQPIPIQLARWQALAELIFIKNEASLRKSVTVNMGFHPEEKEQKAGFVELLAQIAKRPGLITAMAELRSLPSLSYSDEDWNRLGSLIEILKIAAGQLQLLFSESGQVDHIEIAQRALLALGNDEQPTDLALMLDHQIHHLLVDEFQDTSHGQHQLLKSLTAGWQPEDGRTLFCVGDPMQSIYRFREADVGLFLDACEHGIGTIELHPLQLRANFRSHRNVIDWINHHFPAIFPGATDTSLGAVTYTSSVAARTDDLPSQVRIHPLNTSSKTAEANLLIKIIRESQKLRPDDKIAILVRSRNHLDVILPALRKAAIPFRVTETERLSALSVVQDLRALVQATHHNGDRVAWFSLLRSPWCGLTLADLHSIAEKLPNGPLWPALSNTIDFSLSPDGTERLERFLTIIAKQLEYREQLTIREWFEALWLALGGRDVVTHKRDLLAAEVFFATLEKLDKAGRIDDLNQFDEEINKLYAPADPDASDKLQILTMHKAKGLEFDTVILPGLGRTSRTGDKTLLQYLLKQDQAGNEQLLMTTIEASGEPTNAISDFIRNIDKQRECFERQRLLYVATTRAKQQLHLIGHVTFDKNDNPKAPSGSLLAELWQGVKSEFSSLHPIDETDDQGEKQPPPLTRLPANWQSILPNATIKLPVHTSLQLQNSVPEFLWAGELARHIGTVIHGMLEIISREGLDEWHPQRVLDSYQRLCNWLNSLGVRRQQIAYAAKRIQQALVNTLEDEKGRWILQQHPHSYCEYGLSFRQGNGVQHLIIDRILIDETGQRWIIDYKSGSHQEEETLDAFLDSEEERYREQLHRYWHAFYLLDETPSRLALYFPMLKAWREIKQPQ